MLLGVSTVYLAVGSCTARRLLMSLSKWKVVMFDKRKFCDKYEWNKDNTIFLTGQVKGLERMKSKYGVCYHKIVLSCVPFCCDFLKIFKHLCTFNLKCIVLEWMYLIILAYVISPLLLFVIWICVPETNIHIKSVIYDLRV